MSTAQPNPDERTQASEPDTTLDSDTQSSAASAQGDRTEGQDGGNNAPNEPAEGAETAD